MCGTKAQVNNIIEISHYKVQWERFFVAEFILSVAEGRLRMTLESVLSGTANCVKTLSEPLDSAQGERISTQCLTVRGEP